ncbi:hypothetical protein DFJ73DRAFT_916160 [Zopfochytrium polystomum]|nr:hypothetical protein DFJ73DRAFT_916160 [Zopfochytrium polystomum]
MRDQSTRRQTSATQSQQKLQLLFLFLVSAAFLVASLLTSNVAADPAGASCLSCLKKPSTSGGSPPSSPLYRALTPADRQRLDKGKSIKATDPKANITPVQHQAGRKPSQYISTTTDKNVAKGMFNSGNGVVQIDKKKLKGNTIDVQKLPGANKPLAAREKEVLVKNKIPAKACTLIRRDGDGAVTVLCPLFSRPKQHSDHTVQACLWRSQEHPTQEVAPDVADFRG